MTRPKRDRTLPAMVNAHSHAFQRDLRGAAERPAPEAHAADDFWSWREAMYRLAGAHDPGSMREAAGRVYAEMAAAGYGAVGEFHYVHHRPDGTPYDDPNAMAIAVAEAARAHGLAIVLLPAAYHRAGWDGGDLRPPPASAASATPTSATYLARVDALRAWAAEPRRRARRRRRAQHARGARGVAGGDRGLRGRARARAPRPRPRAAARAGGVPRRARRLADRAAAPHRLPRPAHEPDPRHPRLRPTTSRGWPRAARSSSPARRRRGASATGTSRRSCTATPACGSPIGSDSNVRVDPFEEARELETLARRERRTRHALLAAYGDLWGELAANGRASLGLEDAGTVTLDRDHPDLAGVADADLPLAVATCASAAVVRGLRPA